jgi:hypothetical protein
MKRKFAQMRNCRLSNKRFTVSEMKCIRCAKKSPPDQGQLFAQGWAALNTGGYMCPKCYAKLGKVRQKAKDYERKLMVEFMRVNP